MKKEFIPYQPSLDMKELGFDEPCVYYVDKDNNSYIYNFQTHPDEFIEGCGVNVIPTPTLSQGFRFFREKYGLYHSIGLDNSLENDVNCDYQIINHSQSISEFETDFKSYEEAELACLIKLIKIVKQQKQ
jgi:hypothetical protein